MRATSPLSGAYKKQETGATNVPFTERNILVEIVCVS